jgi:hypothetical protein
MATRVVRAAGVGTEAEKRRSGAPRGRARLRHWRVEHPRKVFRRVLSPASQPGEGSHATGAAFRTSALAALRSLAGAELIRSPDEIRGGLARGTAASRFMRATRDVRNARPDESGGRSVGYLTL